ncbi:HAD family hydrolase [Streptomyces sp. NPDC056773]|uniref:HAD family hydrolase n=1 Tax=unclassified Streptomyces TaxID=2593676 RepID=UPI0036CF9E4D
MSQSPLFPYQLIATDLDGTLVRSDHTVSARTTAALAAAVSAGARHVVVTGRVAQWTRSTLAEIGYRGLAVCGQGGQLYDAGRDALVSSVPLDRELAAHVVARVEAVTGPLSVAVMPLELADPILVGPGFPVPPMPSADIERVHDAARLWDRPIGKVQIQHPHLTDDQLTEAAREAVGDLVTVVMAGPTCVELLPLGLSKATGLALAAEALGTTAEGTIAFGDMPNDIPMFAWAGHSVAMANAHDSLKAVADEITAGHDEDGVAVVLERHLRPLAAPLTP